MFTDPIFRIALVFSLAAHLAFVLPMKYASKMHKEETFQNVDLNYIVVEYPRIAREEEVYSLGGEEDASSSMEDAGDVLNASIIEENTEDDNSYDGEDGNKSKDEAYLKYYNVIREKIRSSIHKAVERKENGALHVEFSVAPSGRFIEIKNLSSDLPPHVSRVTKRAIASSGPFPNFPPELGNAPIVFTLDIKFAVR